MKDKILILSKFIFLFFITSNLCADELKINSTEVKIDKKSSNIIFQGNIKAIDENKNILEADKAIYTKSRDVLTSIGPTKIITSNNYLFESKDVIFDNENKIIKSNFPTKIIDPEGNTILVNMFNYNFIKNILFSKGKIELSDKNKNIYKFSEIYIDEKKER